MESMEDTTQDGDGDDDDDDDDKHATCNDGNGNKETPFTTMLRHNFPILGHKKLHNTFLDNDWKCRSFSLMKCSCDKFINITKTNTIGVKCENCRYIQELRHEICKSNGNHDSKSDNRCIFAGPHPLDAMLTWYHYHFKYVDINSNTRTNS